MFLYLQLFYFSVGRFVFVHGIRAMGGGGQSQGLLFGRGGSLPYPRDIVVPHNDYDCFFLLSFFSFFSGAFNTNRTLLSHIMTMIVFCVFFLL